MKIATVVVTYNRLELLKKCVESLVKQTRKPDEIIIVNNNSTDGTVEWLASQNELTILHQENLGGAGGFYAGIKVAFEKGYDWILMFEDELIAAPSALETYEKYTEQNISAIACSRISFRTNKHIYSDILNFNSRSVRDSKRYRKISESHFQSTRIKLFAASFEGLLINSNAVKKIGYPKKEFFIAYDDVEYCMRLGEIAPIYLITDIKIYKMRDENEKYYPNNYYLKLLYGLRNYTYLEHKKELHSKDANLFKYLSIILKYLNINRYYFSKLMEIKVSIFKHFMLSILALYDGLRGRFDKYSIDIY